MLWNAPNSANSQLIPGRLDLCKGMPVMIRNNAATELGIMKGQEVVVYGWSLAIGSRNQLILDTLFVELENPPRPVKFDGLPNNIVPLTRNTTSTLCYLPDDSDTQISRSQVDVMPNFSMTDYASQGKTRVYNVVDLNNSRTHQAYYTALSRSASAAGTLIIQGFENKMITGGATGALRQEFQSLELLDHMTKLRYEFKLLKKIAGTWRNELIYLFRQWKGGDFVPLRVHKAIRWSKKDLYIKGPLPEVEKSEPRQTPAAGKPKTLKRKRSTGDSNLSNKRLKLVGLHVHFDPKTPDVPVIAQLVCQRIKSNPVIPRTPVSLPLGLSWQANSCAYDAVLTIPFNIWAENPELRERQYFLTSSEYLIFLTASFHPIYNGTLRFEKVRDVLRCLLQSRWPEKFRWGHGTSIHELPDRLLESTGPVIEAELYCPRLHLIDQYIVGTNSCCLMILSEFTDIQDYVDNMEVESATACSTCGSHLMQRYAFVAVPKFLAFDLTLHGPTLNNTIMIMTNKGVKKYKLKGVLYYNAGHSLVDMLRSTA